MKILVITNLFPYPENETSGIFITNRLKVLKEFDIEFKTYGIIGKDTFILKIVKYIFRKQEAGIREASIVSKGIEYNYANFKRTLMDSIYKKAFRKDLLLTYSRRLSEKISNLTINESFDIIHAHGMYTPPSGLVAKLLSEKLGIPYVVTCHGSDINLAMPNNKELYNNVLEQAGKVIFVSNALLNNAKLLGYSGKNAVVIPNGIDPKIFMLLDKEKIKKELGLNKKVVGFVGGLKKIKRADKLPEIFEYILSKKDVEFLVVGDGELRENVEKECQKRNLNVKFVGRVSQDKVPYYMNAMDVMILPSRNEGFGAVIIEAQACGVPVVGSSNGGIPEAIGDGGMAVEEGEDFEKRFADAVVELLKNPINSSYLRERALGFSWENIVKKEVKVYEEVVK